MARYDFDTLPPVDRILVAAGEDPLRETTGGGGVVDASAATARGGHYRNVGSGEMAYDASFADIGRTHDGSLARSFATVLLYANAPQVADTTWPVAEVLTALTLSVMGAAFVFAATHPRAPQRARVRLIPQPA